MQKVTFRGYWANFFTQGHVGFDTSSTFYVPAMKIVSFLIAFFYALLSATPVHADRILVLGDSLSAAYDIPWESGWVQLMTTELDSKHQVINASVSGEATGGGLSRVQTLLDTHQPDWVIIQLGGNDGLRGYPLNVIENNLMQIGRIVKNFGAKPIYFGIRIPPNYGDRYSNAFAAIFPTISEEMDAPFLNLYREQIATNQDLMQDDGIHPNETAQPLIKDYVLNFLRPLINRD
jgi:acyl-CoA thioesterase I